MRAFEARAIENIATAPAARGDRRWAAASVAILIGLFVVSLPFSPLKIGQVPAFVPTAVGASIVALVLTTVLLYVQYRIERDLKLALLAIAYAYAALTQTLYLLTFPGVFSAGGLFGAGPQTGSSAAAERGSWRCHTRRRSTTFLRSSRVRRTPRTSPT